MPQPEKRLSDSKLVPEPQAENAAAPKSWMWIAKLGAATFGTIVAPIIVALVLKVIEPLAPPATHETAAQKKEGGQRKDGDAASSAPPVVAASEAAPGSAATETTNMPAPRTTGATAEKSGGPVAESKAMPGTQAGQAKPSASLAENGKKTNSTATPEQAPPKAIAGKRPLFNGHDFTGWIVPKAKHWTVDTKTKCIVADNANDGPKKISFLISNEEFSDFRLHLEFRMDAHSNSGIALRTLEKENFAERMQVQLWGGNEKSPKIKPTGTIIGLPASADDPDLRPKVPAPLRPAGSWNVAEIEFRGPRLKVTVNGTVIQDVGVNKKVQLPNARPDLLRTSGRIGLQSEAGRIEFRRIEVESLAKAP